MCVCFLFFQVFFLSLFDNPILFTFFLFSSFRHLRDFLNSSFRFVLLCFIISSLFHVIYLFLTFSLILHDPISFFFFTRAIKWTCKKCYGSKKKKSRISGSWNIFIQRISARNLLILKKIIFTFLVVIRAKTAINI